MRCILFSLLFVPCVFFCQTGTIQILDKESKDALPGVNIVFGQSGGITDIDGTFTFSSPDFPTTVVFSYVGYNNLELKVDRIEELPAVVYLQPSNSVLDQVTITGAKYEQNVTRSSVTVDIIKPDLLRSVNSVSSDKILNKVPGVQMLDGQANIRGGSGYSYGAGSRVMMLLDGIPALQPDAGFPNWGDIPIENLSQVEILKGAASTLYGSAALNGIINFRSSYATSEPETRFSAATSVFLSPKDKAKKWWGDTLRYETNFTAVHKQKFGNLDFIASGLYNKLEGFNQFTNESRGRANVNLRYRKTDRLVFGLSAFGNFGKSSSFFLWDNPGSGAMRPLQGTVSDRMSRRIYIDPTVSYTDANNNRHRLLTRTVFVNNENNTNQSNKSVNQYAEYQFQRNFEAAGLVLTAGTVGAWTRVDSEILGDSIFNGANYAAYLQMDKTFSEKLTVAAGIRYEYVRQNSPEYYLGDTIPGGLVSDGQLISRLSANYQIGQYSSLRASFGQGYRYPTLTERFVTTTFGGFSIFANPALNPEYGWSSELGIKQGFALGGFKGFLDGSVFISEYEDMIEFTFVFESNKIGFQPRNVGSTRILGYEAGIAGKAELFGIPVNLFGGYTYIDPTYKNYDISEQVRNSVSEPVNVLKYRSKHQLKMDAEASIGKFRWGWAVQRVSHVINIDKAFETVPPINIDLFGIGEYRDLNNNGYWLLDTRIAWDNGRIKITALCNNLLNEEYTIRPALIEAPRNIGLRLDYKLN